MSTAGISAAQAVAVAAGPGAPCARQSIEVGESPRASAPSAVAWLALEQAGPWGREALTSSRLDHELGQELARRAKASRVRVALIRSAQRRRDPVPGRQVLLAHTRPGQEWLRTWRVDDPYTLLELDLDQVAAGVEPPVGQACREPVMLVCTNAKRDSCCARDGLPLARALGARHPGQVWQCSHLGGHRFAPTAALLPSGYVYGRLDLRRAEEILASAGGYRLAQLDNLRGRSTWTAQEQLAEIEVRQLIDELDTRALTITTAGGVVHVSHVDGRAWSVEVRVETDPTRTRPESCGRAHLPVPEHVATRIEQRS